MRRTDKPPPVSASSKPGEAALRLHLPSASTTDPIVSTRRSISQDTVSGAGTYCPASSAKPAQQQREDSLDATDSATRQRRSQKAG